MIQFTETREGKALMETANEGVKLLVVEGVIPDAHDAKLAAFKIVWGKLLLQDREGDGRVWKAFADSTYDALTA